MTLDEAIHCSESLRSCIAQMFRYKRDAQLGSDLELADDCAAQLHGYLQTLKRSISGEQRIAPMPTQDWYQQQKNKAPVNPAERS